MIDANSYGKCIKSLEEAYDHLQQAEQPAGGVPYRLSRSACVKEFELTLEQSGKLLKECLKKRGGHDVNLEDRSFKEVFALAASEDIISEETAECWGRYRDKRNDTAHEYGEVIAEAILPWLPEFIQAAKALHQVAEGYLND